MENLVELQGIDTKLKDLNDLLGDLPSKVEGLNQQEESIKSSLQSKKDRIKELEVELHKKEVDISQLDGKVGSLKDQLFLVTNNKQYDALMKEIDHLKEKKSVFENETIELLDEKEKLTKDMESELTGLSEDPSERRQKLEAAISESADEKTILEKEKQARKDKIDTNIISVYDRVMDARDGLAVVPIVGSGCGGCGAHIPPQTLTEVRAKTGIHRCDICGRFLYNEEKVVN